MLYTCYIHFIYVLYTFCIHSIYILHALYTYYTLKIHNFYTLFWTLFGHVLDKFGGQKWSFSKKFWGCLGYHLASSAVSGKGSKNLEKMFFFEKNKFDKSDVKWPPDENAVLRKFISFFSSCFMHFLFFSYFPFFPPCRLLYTPFGPLVSLNFIRQQFLN